MHSISRVRDYLNDPMSESTTNTTARQVAMASIPSFPFPIHENKVSSGSHTIEYLRNLWRMVNSAEVTNRAGARPNIHFSTSDQ